MESASREAWTAFCGTAGGESVCGGFWDSICASSCSNHVATVSLATVLLLLFFVFGFAPVAARESGQASHHQLLSRGSSGGLSRTQLSCIIFNGCLSLACVALGTWVLVKDLVSGGWGRVTASGLHRWVTPLVLGVTWLLPCLVVVLRGGRYRRSFLGVWLTIALVLAGFLCVSSVIESAVWKRLSVESFLAVLFLPGSVLLLLCAFRENSSSSKDENGCHNGDHSLLTPLNGGERNGGAAVDSDDGNVTPFAKAGIFSKLSFWWLNSLMKKGHQKTLEDADIPLVREIDRAGNRYSLFVEQLERRKLAEPERTRPSVFWAIVHCHKADIFISGFFALLKILTLSAGPVLLNSFIKLTERDEEHASKLEGCALALAMFLGKCLESLSQRQWYFRSRTLGLQVRSLLSAAIYRKQLRLSNTARLQHSSGEITNYVTVDAYRIGEFPFYFHQTWTTSLQLCIALTILYNVVGVATVSALAVIILTVLCNTPLAKLQHKFQSKLMEAQDKRLKAVSESLLNMKVLKLYAWETHFKRVIEKLRDEEYRWLWAFQLRKSYNGFLFWSSPVLVSAATFLTCYLLRIPLYPSNVFTFVATLRLVQEPVRTIPDVVGVAIQAQVALMRIVRFLDAPELPDRRVTNKAVDAERHPHAIVIDSADFSWEENPVNAKPTLADINLVADHKDKVAICGEVGSGKSSLLAAILGEISKTRGKIEVYGRIAYVQQSAWIPTGTIRENILFGSPMDTQRYKETIEKCSLVKDLNSMPFGDLTEIGERGVNLSGGQKQRLQLARALYQDADIYLLDDPFSAVDAHTASSLFNDYVMEALSNKTVLLVTHQVDFLPAFDSILLMADGGIQHSAPYSELITSSKEFQDLVNAHKETMGSKSPDEDGIKNQSEVSNKNIKLRYDHEKNVPGLQGDQLIKKEEREANDTGFKPYLLYLMQNKGFYYYLLGALSQMIFLAGQISQNAWMAANVQNPQVSQLRLITVYIAIGCGGTVFLLFRTIFVVVLGLQSSKSLFTQLLTSLFRAPMSFFDSTPVGRILTRVSSDLSIVDLDVPFALMFSTIATLNACSNLGVLASLTWQVLFVMLLMIYFTLKLQRYYFVSAKQLMRINGTTKSFVANHLAESISGAVTIRAFGEEDRFFAKNLEFVDRNASPFFHNFAASEWLILRLEMMSATILASTALFISLLPRDTSSSGFIGMALSYGLSLNMSVVFSIQNQCIVANYIISVERLNQYMHITSEAPERVEDSRPARNWPSHGRVEIKDLKIRYRPDTPLVLHGISCIFEGGHKIGVVGRTGSGKTTLISALFRLVEPAGGRILIDSLDITKIGLHDLRSRLAIIPQDPTLFNGTVRYNLDPLGQHSDQDIWEVLAKCQLVEAVEEKENGLDSLVIEDGSNWSLGQRQLFCLCRALLRRSKILVLDEATASVDNTTDAILQKTIRTEFAKSTVITVAHRIPTVMDCTMVLAISDGKLVEYDEPKKLMQSDQSLFAQLVNEYRSHAT